jgi:hypothetical protein
MCYIILVIGEGRGIRNKMLEFSSKIKTILPNGVEIYWSYKEGELYKLNHYLANGNNFMSIGIETLSHQAATLSLWHYSDYEENYDYELFIKSKIIVGYGGNGRELNQNPNISYHITSPMSFAQLAASLDSKDFNELFDWACDSNRSYTKLPALISLPYDAALLALQILCQGYLKVYDNPLYINNVDEIDLNWWSDPFDDLNNIYTCFTKYTETNNNPVKELIKIIQQPDLTKAIEQQKLQQLCIQIKKLKG